MLSSNNATFSQDSLIFIKNSPFHFVFYKWGLLSLACIVITIIIHINQLHVTLISNKWGPCGLHFVLLINVFTGYDLKSFLVGNCIHSCVHAPQLLLFCIVVESKDPDHDNEFSGQIINQCFLQFILSISLCSSVQVCLWDGSLSLITEVLSVNFKMLLLSAIESSLTGLDHQSLLGYD